jgi:hypothetical protein
MGVGRSESVRTEMAAIKAGHWQRKLFVITPCIGNRAHDLALSAGAAFRRTAKGTYRDVGWQSLANEFGEAGFRIDIAEPGPGSVVSFDDAGHAEVIAQNLTEPTEFAEAIRRRLEEVGDRNGPTAITSQRLVARGRRGGQKTSVANAAVARRKGKKDGRPPKAKA